MRLSSHYTGIALVAVPKVMQAGIAALTDWYGWRLAEKLYGGNSAAAWSVVGAPLECSSLHMLLTNSCSF